MPALTAEQAAQRAFDAGLLDERQLHQVWGEFGTRNIAPDEFFQAAVRREFLTNYQVDRLMKGERAGYFYGPYKVLYLVGAGSFARVFRAVQRETGQVVAVKVLRKRFGENPTQYSQFVREGKLGCALRHPNIVPIYEVHSRGSTHYLVMEFIEGRNLRDFVKIRKKLAPLEATRLLIDITGGLRYAYEQGLTHRDLKLTNVLVTSTGTAKLVDFGLAAMDETLEELIDEASPNARAIDYAALERATGVRKDDTRSDLYFLGCMYYHMLTGAAPLVETKDRMQRLSKTRFQQIAPIKTLEPDLPGPVLAVVNKAMDLDPTRRYQSPAAMLADLEMAGRRLAAGETGSAEIDQRDQRRLAELTAPEDQRTVMVVESNSRTQDLLRDGLKKAGYRVLVTSDPTRALERVQQDATTAHCLVLVAQDIGQPALDTFNQLADDDRTTALPAVLLLDEPQRGWASAARTGPLRKVLSMPITLKQLRATLKTLLPASGVVVNGNET